MRLATLVPGLPARLSSGAAYLKVAAALADDVAAFIFGLAVYTLLPQWCGGGAGRGAPAAE